MDTDGTFHSKLVYLAGPIDLVDREMSHGWRGEAAEKLIQHGFAVFSPAHAFELPPDEESPSIARGILGINGAAMQHSDMILANLDGPGYGTPIEFQAMVTEGKVCAAFNGNTRSLYVQTWPHYTSMDAAIAALVDHGQ